ncbi:hypothetical protein ACFQ9X_10240 [Catenulispora yoronensis]
MQWTNSTGQPISFLNVRASIPDAPSGGGATATLDLYVDGAFRQTLNLNSKQSWIYEGTNYNNGDDKNPADGSPATSGTRRTPSSPAPPSLRAAPSRW